MTYYIKGFVENSNYIENEKGINSKLCELSPISKTYSKELGFYHQSNKYPDTTFICFSSKEGDNWIELTNTPLEDKILKISNWVCNQGIQNSDSISKESMMTGLNAFFGSEIEKIEVGPIESSAQNKLPGYLFFMIKGEDTEVRLWFADDIFQAHYDEYENVFVPPISNLDDFFLSSSKVQALVDQMTRTKHTELMQEASDKNPFTIMHVEMFDWVDPLNKEHKIPTPWGILIYGLAGDNEDSILEDLEDYILDNSNHTRDEWAEIFPDIFKRTEFTITPHWKKIGIPNILNTVGIYSPIINARESIEVSKITAFRYPVEHIDYYSTTLSHHYKQVALSIIGCHDNRESKFSLTDFYPDYIGVSSTSIDFNRMKVPTQEMSNLLANLITIAEYGNESTLTPKGISKIVRSGILYFSGRLNKITFLVVAKNNLIA